MITGPPRKAARVGLLALLLLAAAAPPPVPLPPARIAVPGPAGGSGEVAVYLSADWSQKLPGMDRAVIVMHGLSRDAIGYFNAAVQARQAAGAAGAATLIIAPRILDTADIDALNAPAGLLRWRHGNWAGGDAAQGPVPASSFSVFDAIIAKLADRQLFPDLHEIVLAGHSAGAQIVQRYAAVHHANPALAAERIALRFVVANPSSYLYFTRWRPQPVAGCRRFDDWKYGFANGVPPYVQRGAAELEQRYRGLDITYLYGTLDTDANHPALDRSCMAEAQGPNRHARGHAWFAHLQAAGGPALHQLMFDVPGVGHDGARMFNSVCGLAALFGTAGCK